MAYFLGGHACSITEVEHKLLIEITGVRIASQKFTQHDWEAFINKDEHRNQKT